MANIDTIDRKSAITLAKNMRRRVQNLTVDKKKMAERIGGVVVGVVAAGAMGSYMGGLELEAQENAAAIDAGEMDDPRLLGGVMDKDLAVGVSLLLAAAANVGGEKISIWTERAANGVLSGYAYSKMFSSAMEIEEEAA